MMPRELRGPETGVPPVPMVNPALAYTVRSSIYRPTIRLLAVDLTLILYVFLLI